MASYLSEINLTVLLAALAPLPLMALLFLPNDWTRTRLSLVKSVSETAAWISFFCSIGAALTLVIWGPVQHSLWHWGEPPTIRLGLGVYYDALSALMSVLVASLGIVIIRYSKRYLDGDPNQTRFFSWLGFTLGSVLTLVFSNNLVMFFLFWVTTSYGLHQLLCFYPDRPQAILAAKKKFLISRLGDAFLIIAIVLCYLQFGTTEYSVIFAMASSLSGELEAGWGISSWMALFFVIGAMTKSAQFPFHSWLPDTMEMPTPVSALMHAGIINAGGFLIVRLSPLIALSPVSLDVLAVVGAVTAVSAAIVMSTQTDIKRFLAYSTVAQMGFMMLQCGLGAFSTAVLHIVGHSCYKAYAFLSSGSVVTSAARNPAAGRFRQNHNKTVFVSLVCGFGIVLAVPYVLGISMVTKPSLAVLGSILAFAVSQLITVNLVAANRKAEGWAAALPRAVFLTGCYFGLYLLFDYILDHSLRNTELTLSPMNEVVFAFVLIVFSVLFWLQAAGNGLKQSAAYRRWYVHAYNGFYFGQYASRLVSRAWPSSNTVKINRS